MELLPATLEGPFARLEPLADGHREGLRAAAQADAEIWALYPHSLYGERFDPFWDRICADRDAQRWLPHAVVAEGVVVGMSSFIAPDTDNAAVEIGGTYLAPAVRGGRVNPQIKRLMLGRAFDVDARRVAFRVDALNMRSRAAVLKLGAVAEGVLRQDRVTWTGRVRDTAVYSVLAAEWPAVRGRLDARLA